MFQIHVSDDWKFKWRIIVCTLCVRACVCTRVHITYLKHIKIFFSITFSNIGLNPTNTSRCVFI